MASNAPRTVAGVNVERDFGYGISTKPAKAPEGEPQPGQSKASRALSLASYFVGGCMAYVYSEKAVDFVLGRPLQADIHSESMPRSSSALLCISSMKIGTMHG